MKTTQAFTLIELMVVVMIVGIVATFAIPNYTKNLERSHRKDAENNLMYIQAAQKIYAARNDGNYWTGGNLAAINTNLGINILANGKTYNCAGGGNAFSCTATRGGWTVTVTDTSSTPSCAPAAACP